MREQYEQEKTAYEAMLPQLNEINEILPIVDQQIADMQYAGLTDTEEYALLH